ncbi:MAG TPA: hypothetical protein VJZ68_01885 [Nitrososphaera sp.]|nr:hypothetical protein [Nitrososphaera sp.]
MARLAPLCWDVAEEFAKQKKIEEYYEWDRERKVYLAKKRERFLRNRE